MGPQRKNKYYFVQGHAQKVLYLSDYRTIKVSQRHFGFLKIKKHAKVIKT